MSSNDPYTYKNENGYFVQTGDSIDVFFSFTGENGIISVSIENKTADMIYVDWRKSGIVLDNNEIFFTEDKSFDNNEINVDISLSNPNAVSFVRPFSILEKTVMAFDNFNFDKIDNNLFNKQYTIADEKGKNRQLDCIKFDENLTPLYIQTFVYVYEESKDTPYLYEGSFYLSELIKNSQPQAIKEQQRNVFYVNNKSKEKQNNKQKKSGSAIAKILDNITVWAISEAVGYND